MNPSGFYVDPIVVLRRVFCWWLLHENEAVIFCITDKFCLVELSQYLSMRKM